MARVPSRRLKSPPTPLDNSPPPPRAPRRAQPSSSSANEAGRDSSSLASLAPSSAPPPPPAKRVITVVDGVGKVRSTPAQSPAAADPRHRWGDEWRQRWWQPVQRVHVSGPATGAARAHQLQRATPPRGTKTAGETFGTRRCRFFSPLGSTNVSEAGREVGGADTGRGR